MTDTENMDLTALESRVDELIRTVDELKNENSALRNQQGNLVTERATLIEKTEQARTRVESMISRLRALETRSRMAAINQLLSKSSTKNTLFHVVRKNVSPYTQRLLPSM
jgi:cell division protein ZapB